VIAPKCNSKDRLVFERCERIRLPIDGREREVRSRRSNRESFVFHELHDITELTHPCGRYRLSPHVTRVTDEARTGTDWFAAFETQTLSDTRQMEQSRDLT